MTLGEKSLAAPGSQPVSLACQTQLSTNWATSLPHRSVKKGGCTILATITRGRQSGTDHLPGDSQRREESLWCRTTRGREIPPGTSNTQRSWSQQGSAWSSSGPEQAGSSPESSEHAHLSSCPGLVESGPTTSETPAHFLWWWIHAAVFSGQPAAQLAAVLICWCEGGAGWWGWCTSPQYRSISRKASSNSSSSKTPHAAWWAGGSSLQDCWKPGSIP